MITITVLAVLGIALFAVVRAMFRTTPTAHPVIPAKTHPPSTIDLDVWDARKGDVVSISGAAEDFSDIDFPVDRRSAYESNHHRWVDLSGEFRGRRVYLEVYRHPHPDLIGILDGRKLAIADIGVTEEQLANMDARQDPSAAIEFEGRTWHFESSREIGYFENETGQAEGLYRWLFREQDGARLLCIEKWEGEPFDVRIARRLKPEDITMYRAA
jgi:Domain of unknown function (DUF4178)